MIHPFDLQSAAAVATLVLTAVIILLFGSTVFARTYRKNYGLYFAFSLLGVILWCVGDLIVLFARDRNLLHFGAELFYIGPMIIPIFIWFFAISYPENRRIKPPVWLFASVLFLAYAFVFLRNVDFFIKEIVVTDTLNLPTPQLPGFLLYAGFLSFFFMVAYWAFFTKIRRLHGLNRNQVLYTFYGALIASVPALLTNLSLPVLGYRNVIWVGPFFALFFAAAVTLAIVRHRLFDIRPVIVRSLGYALTIVVVSATYGALVFGLAKVLFGLKLSFSAQIGLALATGVAALVFQNVKRFFDNVTKRLFYRDAYDVQTFFDEFNKALVSTIDLDGLLKGTSEVVARHLKAEFCIVGVKDGGEVGYRLVGTETRRFDPADIAKLRLITPHIRQAVIVSDDIDSSQATLQKLLITNNIALLGRLTSNYNDGKEGLGYMVLGPKKSGNPYNSQDVQAIEALVNELIIALQNALRFEEIERFNETLQEKVNVATRQLKASNRKLKKLNDSKDDFIGMASHQLRTPLTSAKGYISLVLDGDAGKINKDQKNLLEQAFASSQRMVYLIADLLNVSRLKTGKFVIERSPTDLPSLVSGELDQLKTAADAHNITLSFEEPKNFPSLMLDETKTRQVVMNFLDNAIYYTPTGGTIRVELRELPKTIEFEVHDNGIGVPKDEQHNLFTKFYRAKNAQRARPDGTGLGLYMARKVVVAQGGSIIFHSKEGEGSTFGFSFPKTAPKIDPEEVSVQ